MRIDSSVWAWILVQVFDCESGDVRLYWHSFDTLAIESVKISESTKSPPPGGIRQAADDPPATGV